ncbi:transmembrane channel-like protein [Colias croceus]|uniref:transmembrane channel-like protein n=1 Tax=Colias crocea TaxID=72248 RepID=UPI001E27DFE1|nr:transmembrane channel-like protein [Colias croceus]
MTSPGVNLFHLPSETPVSSDVKFSSAGDVSEDEDYSASLSAVLRQRRASVRRSRKGRTRRPSSPFLPEDNRSRRRSSVFTTSSGDTAISIDETPAMTQEQIFENIHLHKEVLTSVKQQPLGMRRKLKIVHQAKAYIKRHEGQLQERLAQSKCTKDIYARFSILLATKWQQLKREAANTSNLLIPWELRIKEIESHFGSVVASYFTFLRWLFWVNLVIGFILLVFVIVPEYLTANPVQDGERKIIMEEERRNATNLLTLWEFDGVFKYSPIFYGYYSNVERSEYKMPLAYFLTGLVVYVYSFVAILRKMAENSRMSKLSEKEDECIFSWKLFTGWDFMIGNAETAHNRIASVILGFKEALLEEAEKKKNLGNWRIISLRAIVNICVVILLIVSAFAVVTVVSRSDDIDKSPSWWRENETTTVVTVISITFPIFFELLGFLEHYHPRKQLRLQLARIMLLNLLNLYSLIFALFSKIEGMSGALVKLQPQLNMNDSAPFANNLNMDELSTTRIPTKCLEISIPCLPCHMMTLPIANDIIKEFNAIETTPIYNTPKLMSLIQEMENNINFYNNDEIQETTVISVLQKELERLRNLNGGDDTDENESDAEEDHADDYEFYDTSIDVSESTTVSDSPTDIISTEEIFTGSASTEFENQSDLTVSDTTTESYFSNTIQSTNSESNTENTYSSSQSTSNTEFTLHTSSETVFQSTESKDITTLFQYIFTTDSSNTYDAGTEDVNPTEKTTLYPNNTTLEYFSNNAKMCPNISFNCSIDCGGNDITQIFFISNCAVVDIKCFVTQCVTIPSESKSFSNETLHDTVYYDKHKRKMYNLTVTTRKKLLKLCWETMFGQELVKLTMMDLVFVLLGTLFMDFFRALFVRYMNKCCCWDLEKKFPEYGDFKIAENILHLINNQGMVWMGMFFSPGLVVLNVFKLMIMMYLRSWAVMTCNVPHEVVFRVSKSNNFYLALLLTMLFLCVLPVGYTIVWVKPSWHCGPFSEYDKIYKILTTNIYKILPETLNFALEYIASPAIVIPLLVLLILIIYYLTSLTNSLREANNDLKIQLRRERTEERRKMFQLADTRRRTGSSSIDNTPFGRWKKALPSLPISKSIDSDDRKTTMGEMDIKAPEKIKRRGIFAKIVGLALDKKIPTKEPSDILPSTNNDDETDTDFHESLPKEILKMKDIIATKKREHNIKRNAVDFTMNIKNNVTDDKNSKQAVEKSIKTNGNKEDNTKTDVKSANFNADKKLHRKQTSESSNQSKQSDSISSVIPVITISTTESDEEIIQNSNITENKEKTQEINPENKSRAQKDQLRKTKNSSDLKSLQRQSSFESIHENKITTNDKFDKGGHKYQYSL